MRSDNTPKSAILESKFAGVGVWGWWGCGDGGGGGVGGGLLFI